MADDSGCLGVWSCSQSGCAPLALFALSLLQRQSLSLGAHWCLHRTRTRAWAASLSWDGSASATLPELEWIPGRGLGFWIWGHLSEGLLTINLVWRFVLN